MLYPLKFKPLYKNYIWGGRNLEMLGKILPEGKVAESWEVSCHPDGTSIVSNGIFEGMPLTAIVERFGADLVGTSVHREFAAGFPLLVKLIDANDNLSVQVHPDDNYARINENGQCGKSETWFVLSSEPGVRLVYGNKKGLTRDAFLDAVKNGRTESCLQYMDVRPGDAIFIPAGTVHAIGRGMLIAEVQQNSNITYRIYDYDRIDKGEKRPLHIDKAADVIEFNTASRTGKYPGLTIKTGHGSSKTFKVACKYFSMELYEIGGRIEECCDSGRFAIHVVTGGKGLLTYDSGTVELAVGESVLIPASIGRYAIEGSLKSIKTYVPDIENDVVSPLLQAGYSRDEICRNVLAGRDYAGNMDK